MSTDERPAGDLSDSERVDREAERYAAEAVGYGVSVRDAWRDGYALAEERWGDAASESARLDVLNNDRLRAELAETRAELHGATGAAAVLRERGDALADAKNWVGHVVQAERWRSVRGDAPAVPPADPEPARPTFRDDPHPLYPHFPARGPGAVEAALDRLSRYGSGAEVHDLLVSARAELEHLIPAGPLLERFPAPAVELPVTLSSVDDVRERVAEAIAQAIGHRKDYDTPDCSDADSTLGCQHPGGHPQEPGCEDCAAWGWPCSVALTAADAAIEAARGGSR